MRYTRLDNWSRLRVVRRRFSSPAAGSRSAGMVSQSNKVSGDGGDVGDADVTVSSKKNEGVVVVVSVEVTVALKIESMLNQGVSMQQSKV